MNEIEYNNLVRKVKDISKHTSLLISSRNTDYWNPSDSAVNIFSAGNDTLSEENNMSKEKKYVGKKPEKVLKDVFGYKSFRPLQKEIISNVLEGHDTLAIMPTGGGKSICYQIPALIMDGLTIIVSPLIALMQDQVTQLESYGIEAVFLNSTLDWNKYCETADKIRNGNVQLLYISPEGLNTQKVSDILHSEKVNLKCITIDEAHCISEWGHDFRPDYLEIASIREQFPEAVCLALTATATNQVRKDIIKQLKLESPQVLVASFNRPNIYLEVKRKNNAYGQVVSFINEHKGESGIIYCFSRKQVDSLTQILNQNGIKALNYHAGLSDEERAVNQEKFIRDKVNIIVATVAFGMGINKPDVRFVIHFDMPKSIEQYYQEIGRAGRDGLPANALLLYSSGDIHKIRFFFDEKSDRAKAERLLSSMVSYAESSVCRRKMLLQYFGEKLADDVFSGEYKTLSAGGNIFSVNSRVVEKQETDFANISGTEENDNCCCDICSLKTEIDSSESEKSDMTIPVQKLISCILRTGQFYSRGYVIDILLGSKNKKIIERGHETISTYGIGRELKKSEWVELTEVLIHSGFLKRKNDYDVITVTDKGMCALQNRDDFILPVSFNADRLGKDTKRKDVKKKAVSKIDADDKEAVRIAEELKKWRRNKAEELNVPPFVIFGDKTLFSIASVKPHSSDELLECYGIGGLKAEKFGETILRIVNGDY